MHHTEKDVAIRLDVDRYIKMLLISYQHSPFFQSLYYFHHNIVFFCCCELDQISKGPNSGVFACFKVWVGSGVFLLRLSSFSIYLIVVNALLEVTYFAPASLELCSMHCIS